MGEHLIQLVRYYSKRMRLCNSRVAIYLVSCDRVADYITLRRET
jgi:hypothetical protein